MADDQVRRALLDAQRTLTGMEFGVRPTGFALPIEGHVYARGTTLPLMVQQMTQRASGLFVPSNATAEKYPIDLMATYLTGEEIFGQKLPVALDRLVLAATPRRTGIEFCVSLMRRIDDTRGDWRRLEGELIDEWFTPEGGRRVKAILGQGSRRLVTSQGVLTLLKRVLQSCPEAVDEPALPSDLTVAYFGLTDSLHEVEVRDGESVEEAERRLLAAEIVSNQWFNTDQDIVGLLARHQTRWADTPRDLNPRQLFQAATGLSLTLVQNVALALWAVSQGGSIWTTADELVSSLTLDGKEVQAVLDYLSASPDRLGELLSADEAREGADWSFSAFEQYPLIADDGGVVIISSSLLLRRVFSWTSTWDVRSSSRLTSKTKQHFTQLVRDRAESQIRVAFADMYPEAAGKRVYDEGDQGNAYSTGKQLPERADLVVDDVDSWLVVEITSSMPTRETVAATTTEAFIDDLLKLLAKVRQIDSSIRLLRGDESALTGHSARPRQFIPVLVCTEGFPVNPMTVSELERQTAAEGLLAGDDVLGLRVVSSEDLEVAQAYTETDHVTLVSLLRDHAASGLRSADLRSYIIAERHPTRLRPMRLDATVDVAFAELMDALVLEPPHEPAPLSESE